jgi:protein SCO1/2
MACFASGARAVETEDAGRAARVQAMDPRRSEVAPPELEAIGIDDRAGTTVPADVSLVDHQGRAVRIGDYFDGRRPVVLTLAYYSCPMLCTLVLNGVNDGLRALAWPLGSEYRVVTVSIDPRDTSELAREKRANYLKSYGKEASDDGWVFLTGSESEVRRLANAVGFHYRWDEASQQYAHAAGAFVVTPKGVLSRVLYGLEFRERDLRLSLLEAAQGTVGSAMDKVLLFCFHYDPATKSWAVAATRVMQAGGLLTVLLLAGWLVPNWRRSHSDCRA